MFHRHQLKVAEKDAAILNWIETQAITNKTQKWQVRKTPVFGGHVRLFTTHERHTNFKSVLSAGEFLSIFYPLCSCSAGLGISDL